MSLTGAVLDLAKLSNAHAAMYHVVVKRYSPQPMVRSQPMTLYLAKPDLTDVQAALLTRMKRRPLVLSGYETDDQRLAILQLYAAKLAIAPMSQAQPEVMQWRITSRGRAVLRARELLAARTSLAVPHQMPARC